MEETFTYDDMNRLTGITLNNFSTMKTTTHKTMKKSFVIITLAMFLAFLGCHKDPKPNLDNPPIEPLEFTSQYGNYIVLTQSSGQRWLFYILPSGQAMLCLSDYPEAHFTANNEYKGELCIPASFTHEGVEHIVTRISGWPYTKRNELTAIIIPNTVTCIESDAFGGCLALSKVQFQPTSNLDSIMPNAFASCPNLQTIQFPNSLKYIGEYAFAESGLKELTFSNNLTIDRSAFWYCLELESVSLPEGMKTITTLAFSYCPKLATVYIPQSVKAIEDAAFLAAALTSITLPDSLVRIGCNAFGSTAISSIKFPQTLKHLSGFCGCLGLNEIIIPNSVTTLDFSAFTSCSNLETVTCLATVPPQFTARNVFEGTSLSAIYVPSESLESYIQIPSDSLAFNGWSQYANIIKPIP